MSTTVEKIPASAPRRRRASYLRRMRRPAPEGTRRGTGEAPRNPAPGKPRLDEFA